MNYDPNLLIIYDGWNDIEREYEYYEDVHDYKFTDKILRTIKSSNIASLNLLIKSYFFYKHDTTDVIPFNSDKINEKVSLWMNSWTSVCQLQEKFDFKTIIILQPLVGTGEKKLSDEEQENFIHFDAKTRNHYYQLYAEALDELNDSCTVTVDLRGGFDSFSETIFFDLGHVGYQGNEIIAEKIYDEIELVVRQDIEK